MKFISFFFLICTKFALRIRWVLERPLFAKCGRNVRFGRWSEFSYPYVEFGDDVYVGPGARFLGGPARILVGSKVMFGPNVIVASGDHNTGVVGSYMFDVKTKRACDDADVVIEDDVWIGAGAILLKGVTVGRGAVVGAMSLVRDDVPPYSIVVGSPARIVSRRFSEPDVQRHEASLREKACS